MIFFGMERAWAGWLQLTQEGKQALFVSRTLMGGLAFACFHMVAVYQDEENIEATALVLNHCQCQLEVGTYCLVGDIQVGRPHEGVEEEYPDDGVS